LLPSLQKSAAEKGGIYLETSQIPDINELCLWVFILQTEIDMPSCTAMVLKSHLAMVICTLGTPGRHKSWPHLGWEATWDHQQT